MSALFTWACLLQLLQLLQLLLLLLWTGSAAQDKTPDVAVICSNSEDCVLPCYFQPGQNEMVQWFRQGALVYRFDRNGSEEAFTLPEVADRVFVSAQQISNGNATLTLRRSAPQDRGLYSCQVQTSGGQHTAKVIVKVEAPIRGLFLEHSRLSGYEEIKCSVPDVFPAPRVTWATEPPTFEDLRPVTRKHVKENGLFSVDSRLTKLKGQPDLIYICKMSTSYSRSTWTASLREKEITGTEGRDLTIRCLAPTYLKNPSLYWTFSRGDNSTLILSYDSQSDRKVSAPSWDGHLDLDVYKAKFGDGSLRLMEPRHPEHSGSYACEFSEKFSRHVERIRVTISGPHGQRAAVEKPSYWWILGVVAAGLVLVLVGLLAFLKLRGRDKKPRAHSDEETELNRVKDGESPQ
ncbi:V-set domain-containing T-cell activation inhibitor 1-like isoform X2 [Poeciliopsis prolifica]|uniref:V-set domain-containing T-cell activation inhibitor 1-like isoform X2 n=1 Tax=Poeciliopsis prolifica TaxID=188132 RepID=UPI002414599D|nr:V-set domain-containing T-cell activation inhibitor 1-like isoform X2 [Poeciliopsis prolifica]